MGRLVTRSKAENLNISREDQVNQICKIYRSLAEYTYDFLVSPFLVNSGFLRATILGFKMFLLSSELDDIIDIHLFVLLLQDEALDLRLGCSSSGDSSLRSLKLQYPWSSTALFSLTVLSVFFWDLKHTPRNWQKFCYNLQ